MPDSWVPEWQGSIKQKILVLSNELDSPRTLSKTEDAENCGRAGYAMCVVEDKLSQLRKRLATAILSEEAYEIVNER
ncbi:hypothetical protein [Sandaracinus amylolyticus]|uniref:hypothetical protein n=1 Tax=Sandaracinus amylolyticus TaxID=927083 RepID=UPI001F46FF5E|nr:hypothetical protein [Sandaracinus amylolyticus]